LNLNRFLFYGFGGIFLVIVIVIVVLVIILKLVGKENSSNVNGSSNQVGTTIFIMN